MSVGPRRRPKEVLKKTEKAADPVEKTSSKYKLPRPLKIGDNVLIADIDKNAVVLSLPDKKRQLLCAGGHYKDQGVG